MWADSVTKKIPITDHSLGASYAVGIPFRLLKDENQEVLDALNVLKKNQVKILVDIRKNDMPILDIFQKPMFIGIQYNFTRWSNHILQILVTFVIGRSNNPIPNTEMNMTSRLKGLVKQSPDGLVYFEKSKLGETDNGLSDIIIAEDEEKQRSVTNPKYEPFSTKMTSSISKVIVNNVNQHLVEKPFVEEIIEKKKITNSSSLMESI